jgi:CheY-like chemotaxis protein
VADAYQRRIARPAGVRGQPPAPRRRAGPDAGRRDVAVGDLRTGQGPAHRRLVAHADPAGERAAGAAQAGAGRRPADLHRDGAGLPPAGLPTRPQQHGPAGDPLHRRRPPVLGGLSGRGGAVRDGVDARLCPPARRRAVVGSRAGAPGGGLRRGRGHEHAAAGRARRPTGRTEPTDSAGSRTERARRAVAEEQGRIARELHDVVAHHMSVISVQAGMAGYVFGSDPGAAHARHRGGRRGRRRREAVDLARTTAPDVVLMDIRMPGMDGIEATRRIGADDNLAGVRILVLTTFDLDEYVYAALRAGASGFLLKDAGPSGCFGLGSRAQAVVLAYESGLVKPASR